MHLVSGAVLSSNHNLAFDFALCRHMFLIMGMILSLILVDEIFMLVCCEIFIHSFSSI